MVTTQVVEVVSCTSVKVEQLQRSENPDFINTQTQFSCFTGFHPFIFHLAQSTLLLNTQFEIRRRMTIAGKVESLVVVFGRVSVHKWWTRVRHQPRFCFGEGEVPYLH